MQWEEWGCPKDKEFYEYMKGYSPVDNIQRAAYPNILVTAGAQFRCNRPFQSYVGSVCSVHAPCSRPCQLGCTLMQG